MTRTGPEINKSSFQNPENGTTLMEVHGLEHSGTGFNQFYQVSFVPITFRYTGGTLSAIPLSAKLFRAKFNHPKVH